MIGNYALNSVHNVDALTLLRGLPDESVDALIADPPYELTELDFDQQTFNWTLFWPEVKRVLKTPHSPVVLFSQQPFTTDLINSNRKWWRHEIVVEFTMPTGYLNAKHQPLKCHQNVEIFSEAGADYYPVFEQTTALKHKAPRDTAEHYGQHKSSTYIDTGRRYPRSIWHFAQRDTAFKNTKSLHPTAKPLACMERLIQTYSERGDLVVDCFAGSGSTGAAAVKMERLFVGADNGLDTKTGRYWADLATERIAKPYTVNMFSSLAPQGES